MSNTKEVKSIDDFLDNLKGFFEEKETFHSCEKEFMAIAERQQTAIGEMVRLQKIIKQSIVLPPTITWWGRFVAYFTFWK